MYIVSNLLLIDGLVEAVQLFSAAFVIVSINNKNEQRHMQNMDEFYHSSEHRHYTHATRGWSGGDTTLFRFTEPCRLRSGNSVPCRGQISPLLLNTLRYVVLCTKNAVTPPQNGGCRPAEITSLREDQPSLAQPSQK